MQQVLLLGNDRANSRFQHKDTNQKRVVYLPRKSNYVCETLAGLNIKSQLLKRVK